jgi:integrase
VYAIELEPETRPAALVWTPAQVAHFLEHTADDRLHFLWRLALLRGFRRGELAGMADSDMDLDAATITVNTALLLVGGKLIWGKPKSQAGERVVGLDSGSVTAGRAHRARRKGSAWQRAKRGRTRDACSPARTVRRSTRTTSRGGSRN